MRRKRWIALAILPILLLAGDFFYWRLAVGQLRSEFAAWTAQAQAAGWVIRHGAISVGGWPDAATLRVENLMIAGDSGVFGRGGVTLGGMRLGNLAWGSDAVLFRTGLTRPEILDVTPIGPSPLRINDLPPIPISAEHLRIRLTLSLKGPPRSVDINAVMLTASIPGLGLINIEHLAGHADRKPGEGRDQAIIGFSVSAQPVTLPVDMHWLLGPEINDVALDGVFNGPWPSKRSAIGRDLAERARSWRDGGGSVELHRLEIGWGQTRLEATATLALDEELQPMGAGTAKITGYGVALDALAATGFLTRSAVQAAKAVLSLLANTPGDDQPEEVEVPLTLQFRTLSVRQVPLLRFPELDWPAP